jgi:hypothetical protein
LEPDRSGGFKGGEQAHSNGAEAKKENVETTRSNELAEEEQETQQDPKPPIHNSMPAEGSRGGCEFQAEPIGRWASAQGQPAKLLLDGEEFDELAEDLIAQLV